MLNHEDIKNMKHYFELIDKEGTGMITKQELKNSLRQANLSISDIEIDDIFHEIDFNRDEIINYSEFLAATISAK